MLIRINGVELDERAVNLESAFHDAPDIDQRRRDAALALAVRELLWQRACELGLEGTGGSMPDDERLDAVIDALLDREVKIPESDEAACRRYFEANRERFRGADVVQLRHILLAAPPFDLEARDRARELAERLIAELREHPARFADLARSHSACSSREQGGSLGPISRGQTVPEFEAVALRLPPGLAERPVESRYGFHVVHVDARRDGEPLPYERVRRHIADYLREQSWRRAVGQYVRVIVGRARIEGIDLGAEVGALVQ